ncbi:MAG TPA: DMT family transporter [Planctomycetaceae bacterium]|nr:DMT family transporter [Planctomycetaceae bacterium]
MAYAWFIFICVVWGGNFILMKKASLWLSPIEIGAWRLIGGAVILAWFWWRTSRRWSIRRRDIVPLAFVILFGLAIPFVIQPYLIARDGSAFIGMMVSFTPLLTILVSIPLLGIYPARRQLFGVLAALGFMALLMREGISRKIPPVDLVLAMTVPLCYAAMNTLIRRSLSHVPSLELSLLTLAAAGALLLPLSTAVPFDRAAVTAADQALALISVAVLGVLGTGIATFIFNQMIHDHGPLFAGMVTNLIPIGAVVFGWLDQEQVTGPQIGALAGLVSMVTIVQFGTARVRPPPLNSPQVQKSEQ